MICNNLSKIKHFYAYYKYIMFFYINYMDMDSNFIFDIHSKDIFEFLVFWANWAKKTISQ